MTGRRRAYANDHSLNTAPLTITPPARDRRVGVEALISAPIVFAVEFVSLFFARALLVWFYNVTSFSVLLVAIFDASFDASISSSPAMSCRRRTRQDS